MFPHASPLLNMLVRASRPVVFPDSGAEEAVSQVGELREGHRRATSNIRERGASCLTWAGAPLRPALWIKGGDGRPASIRRTRAKARQLRASR